MGSAWFTSAFVNFLKFPQIKEGVADFLVGTDSAERLNYLVPPTVFKFQKFEGVKFFVIHCTSICSNSFTSTCLNFLKFPQIKESGPNFLRRTNSAERLNYLVPSSIFQFWKFEAPKFFVIHWISVGSTGFTSTFLKFLKFPQIKEEERNFLVGTNSAERLNYLVPSSVLQF